MLLQSTSAKRISNPKYDVSNHSEDVEYLHVLNILNNYPCIFCQMYLHEYSEYQTILTNGFGVDDALNIIPVDATKK